MIALRVTLDRILQEPPDEVTKKLIETFGMPVCEEYRAHCFRDTWIFESMEEALQAEKIARDIIGKYGYTEILGPDDIEREEIGDGEEEDED
jgi:hypothetical protein